VRSVQIGSWLAVRLTFILQIGRFTELLQNQLRYDTVYRRYGAVTGTRSRVILDIHVSRGLLQFFLSDDVQQAV
jgi:hypothetical protein